MPELSLLDEVVLVHYMSGDPGARSLIDQLLGGEVSLAISAATSLHLWCHEVSDRKAEIHLSALMRFIEQLPLNGDIAKNSGVIYAREQVNLPDDLENSVNVDLGTLKAVNAATSVETGMPIYSRDVEWYENQGCEVLSY
jgi:hypothetical protein